MVDIEKHRDKASKTHVLFICAAVKENRGVALAVKTMDISLLGKRNYPQSSHLICHIWTSTCASDS